jgi:hypothetical protein
MKLEGDRAVVHRLRGRASNRKLPAWVKQRALGLFRQYQQAKQWHDYGPTLAGEELASEHGLKVGKETLRKWLMEAGLWKVRRARVEQVHSWRARRARWGELLQWDTSEHDWLEGRSRQTLYLIAMIDDASSRALARFETRLGCELFDILQITNFSFHPPSAESVSQHQADFSRSRTAQFAHNLLHWSQGLLNNLFNTFLRQFKVIRVHLITSCHCSETRRQFSPLSSQPIEHLRG